MAAMEDVHPKLYPVSCLSPFLRIPPPPTPSPPPLPTPTHTHTNYDQDFKVTFFYLIDKGEFRQAILSGDRSCSNGSAMPIYGKNT